MALVVGACRTAVASHATNDELRRHRCQEQIFEIFDTYLCLTEL
jgi:hypothetical protein